MLRRKNRPWAREAICEPGDERLFFSPVGQLGRKPTKKTQAAWDQAKEICQICPVLNQCRADTLGEEYGVYGGLDEHQRWLFRRALISAVDRWPEQRRMRWAKRIWTMRQDGLLWLEIQVETGIPRQAGEKLLLVWKEHLAAQEAPKPKKSKRAKVVDLPLPEPKAFPEVPGKRHLWVRHRGIVADAWYRGETEDGLWVHVTVQAGKGQANKWIAAHDARIYEPQPRLVLTYSQRPDREAA